MYGGRRIALGDTVYLFSANGAGHFDLLARALVSSVWPTPPKLGVSRQTPRVSIAVGRLSAPLRPLGRGDLRDASTVGSNAPEAELHFKLIRQATPKIVGLSAAAAAFMAAHFALPSGPDPAQTAAV